MKKMMIIACLFIVCSASFAGTVNEELKKVFAKTYPDAQGVSWTEQKNGNLVYFNRKDISYRVMYDDNGDVVFSIKYYGEDNLSPLIMNRVKKAYPDYKIHSIVEKASESNVEYHIVMEGTKKLVTLKADPLGNFEIESKMDKVAP